MNKQMSPWYFSCRVYMSCDWHIASNPLTRATVENRSHKDSRPLTFSLLPLSQTFSPSILFSCSLPQDFWAGSATELGCGNWQCLNPDVLLNLKLALLLSKENETDWENRCLLCSDHEFPEEFHFYLGF